MSTVPADEIAVVEESGLQRTYVWDLVVRSTHWTIVLSMAVLAVTGTYIGNPWIYVPPDEAGLHFMMGTVKAVHFYAAIAFTLAVLSRLLWMVISPNRWARWHQFIPVTRERWQAMWKTLGFYLFARRTLPPLVGHNPLAGAAYMLVFGLYLVMIITGLGLYGMSAHVDSWMAPFEGFLALTGGAQVARYVHHVVMWLLIGFFIHHFYSGLLASTVEKNGTLESIFTGYKWMRRRDDK